MVTLKIVRCNIFRYDLPLSLPLQIKGHIIEERSGLLIRLEDTSGAAGWGEVAPLVGVSKETLDQAQQQLFGLRPLLIGAIISPDQMSPTADGNQLLPVRELAPSVRWGLEQALWNLRAAACSTPLQHILCDHPRSSVSINGLLTGSSEEILASARTMVKHGFKAVKLKVGRRRLADDIALTLRVREAIGDATELRLDANRAWNWSTALQFSKAVAGCSIAYIEEPLADPAALPRFLQESDLPVALDETLSEVRLEDLHAFKGVAAMVLKPSLLGGLNKSTRIARKAMEWKATPVFSALFETGLTMVTLAQMAAAITGEDVSVGLDTYRWLQADVLKSRLDMHEGRLDLTALKPSRMQPDYALLQELVETSI